MVDNRKVYIQIKHHRKIEMTEKQFDIFVALEEKTAFLFMLCLKNRISSREVETFVSVLFGRGLVSRCSTSEKGFESLEPYKTKCAIFIAAGFGSRLSPVTLLIAEPLVKVHGV